MFKGSQGHLSNGRNCTNIRLCSLLWASAKPTVHGHRVLRKVRIGLTLRSSIRHLCCTDRPRTCLPTQLAQKAAHICFSHRRKQGQGDVEQVTRCPRMLTVSYRGHFKLSQVSSWSKHNVERLLGLMSKPYRVVSSSSKDSAIAMALEREETKAK